MFVSIMESHWDLFGPCYLDFKYERAQTEHRHRTIQMAASCCYRNERELFSDFIDLGGEA